MADLTGNLIYESLMSTAMGEHEFPEADPAEADPEEARPSSEICPLHGAGCEAWA